MFIVKTEDKFSELDGTAQKVITRFYRVYPGFLKMFDIGIRNDSQPFYTLIQISEDLRRN